MVQFRSFISYILSIYTYMYIHKIAAIFEYSIRDANSYSSLVLSFVDSKFSFFIRALYIILARFSSALPFHVRFSRSSCFYALFFVLPHMYNIIHVYLRLLVFLPFDRLFLFIILLFLSSIHFYPFLHIRPPSRRFPLFPVNIYDAFSNSSRHFMRTLSHSGRV